LTQKKEHFLSELIEKKEKQKVKVTVYLPLDLVKRAKHACIDLNLKLSELVERAVEKFLTEQEKQS